jgi:hypothetical protein
MRRLAIPIALFFCIYGNLSLANGQTQPSTQTPVTSQPPAPKQQPPAQQPVVIGYQPIYGQPQQPQASAAPTAPPVTLYQANPAILQQYGVTTSAVQQVAYAQAPVYGMAGPPVVAASASPVMTTNGSLSLGGGPIAQWLVQRVGKTHTWSWNHTVTRPTVTPAAPVAGPTSYVATTPAPVQMAYQATPVQVAPPVYYQQVTQYQPTVSYQPVTSYVPVAPPVQQVPVVQQQPPPAQTPPCPPTKRDEDAPPPPTRPSSQIPPPRHGLFNK